jgi:hypothetical protein
LQAGLDDTDLHAGPMGASVWPIVRLAAVVLTKPAEVGVLLRALAECCRAATVAFGQIRNMANPS